MSEKIVKDQQAHLRAPAGREGETFQQTGTKAYKIIGMRRPANQNGIFFPRNLL